MATHAQLTDIQLDDRFRVIRETIVARGHHYGIALIPGAGETLHIEQDNYAMTRYVARGEGPLEQNGRIRFLGEVSGVHQIAYANGGVYVASTNNNSVTFQGDDGQYTELRFHGVDRDVHHVNSVFPCGRRVLVMLHNRGNGPSEIVVLEHGPDVGMRPTATIRLPHSGCHNVFLDGGRLLYNASDAGQLVAMNLVRRKIERVVQLRGHTKGLSVTADHAVVGCSPHTSGPGRFTSKGALAVLDRRTLAVVASVELGPDRPIGSVNEVRALGGLEMAHDGDASVPDGLRPFRLRDRVAGAMTHRIRGGGLRHNA